MAAASFGTAVPSAARIRVTPLPRWLQFTFLHHSPAVTVNVVAFWRQYDHLNQAPMDPHITSHNERSVRSECYRYLISRRRNCYDVCDACIRRCCFIASPVSLWTIETPYRFRFQHDALVVRIKYLGTRAMGQFLAAGRSLRNKSLDELTDWVLDTPGHAEIAQAEFLRRQTQAMMDTAEFTRQNARYMLWSVIILAASAFIQMLVLVIRSI